MEIKEINYGIACRIKDTIYINSSLKNTPKLYEAILKHEKSHSSGFEKKDIYFDIHNEEIQPFKKEYYLFVLTHPLSWIEYLPFGIYDKKFVWNPMMTMVWVLTILGGFVLWKLTGNLK